MTHHDELHGAGQGQGAPDPLPKAIVDAIAGIDFPAFFKSWIPFFIGFLVAFVVGWLIWPTLVYSKKEQPISFNHLIHSDEAGMSCEDCHFYDDQGRFSGVPQGGMCLDCHTWSSPQNEDNQKEKQFLEEFVNEDDELKKPLIWYVYSKQPDCVYFSHIAHTEKGGFECQECHGDHGQSTKTPPYYKNRMTGYSRLVYETMKMTDCGDCHTKHDKPQNNACFVCHK